MNPSRFSRRATRGVALVVVLAFVVLLTGLIVAYFSRSMTGRLLSNSSAGQTRSALLAQSATDTIIAGFRQEIKNGSSTPSPALSPSPSPANIYIPTTNANAVPVRFPTPAPGASPADPIPNLVRASLRGDSVNGALPSPAVPSYASAVNSTGAPATDGRMVSAARWNSHFLIPGQSTATNADSTPDSSLNFASVFAPDWVLVTRNGPAVQTAVVNGSVALNDANPSNGNFVIGRYAYAVYDEGGLLDMNVAGHPTPAATASQTGFTSTQVGRKGSLALADLTQLPLVKSPNPAAPADYLAQVMVDRIVGWRNFASAGLAGSSYPNFTFTSAQAADWFTHFANRNASGFLKVYGGGTANTGATDQAFLSRQQLLKLRASIGFGANALQYMGTFSRSLEQPSYIPAHIQYPDGSTAPAPSINNVASTMPPSASFSNPSPAVDSYLGNNDAAGLSGTSAAQDIINPSFLTVRVLNTVSQGRNDGSDLARGEPLVKKRYSLQRLSWLTYKGPSAGNLADPNVQQLITAMGGNPGDTSDPVYQLVAQGNATNIQKYFGLTWSTGTGAGDPPGWTYSHGSTHIMTLSEVAGAGREPDFAELLKASINAGSLAKGGPNLHNDQGNYQYVIDTSVDYNVLQIMANVIDQFDLDGYPTVIKFVNSGITRSFRGVEDLPYFYRYHPMTVCTRLPSPLLASSDKIDWRNGPPTPLTDPPQNPVPAIPPVFKTTSDCRPGDTVSDGGEAVFLYAPDVWNPHDSGGALANPNAVRPTRFRLAVLTQDMLGQTPVWNTGTVAKVNDDWYRDIPPDYPDYNRNYSCIPRTLKPLYPEAATALTFSDNGGKLFREPTLLWRGDVPAGSNIGIDPQDNGTSLAGPYVDVNTGVAYFGVQIGKSPVSYVGYVDPAHFYGTKPGQADLRTSASASNNYIFQAGNLQPNQDSNLPPGAYAQYTFRLQYLDPNGSGKWVTYDEKYPDFHGLYRPNLIVNKADYGGSKWMNPNSAGQINDSSTGYDPRTPRFGIGTEASIDEFGSPFLEPGAHDNYRSGDDTGNQAFAAANPSVLTTQRPGSDRGNHVNYSNPGMTSDPGRNQQIRWFDGVGFSASNNQNSSPLFYCGLLSQNDAGQTFSSIRGGVTSTVHIYYEDADGVGRRAMGAYARQAILPSTYTATNGQGLPEMTANTYAGGSNGVGSPTAQNLSRPLILNRPFRSVAEMAYASRGGVWKQIDFFTPESGDVALLDVFCVTDLPTDGIVAGKVNLNTHQVPVLKAIVAGTARDELSAVTTRPAYALTTALTADEANNVALKLTGITTDATKAWRGPLLNVAGLVGRYVPQSVDPAAGTDVYTFTETVQNKQYTYAGLSAALDGTVYTDNTGGNVAANYKIQRMRESAIRALADTGQTRVWNLLIDVVAQTGRYAPNSTTLDRFTVDGETRVWVHVAIDRFTGEVIDRQIEIVTE